VDRELAEAMCAAEGKRLLTEAEFAFAATNGARGSPYSWGEDVSVCAHAVVSRGAALFELDTPDLSTECRSQPGRTLPFGPVASGPSGDETLETGGLRHLGGNVAEWVQDTFESLAAPCWNGRPVLVDPVCRSGTMHALRGGAWRFETWTASATFRVAAERAGTNAIGFRCARDAR
jgi:formylglycine-generating enzyme required for sulfatase activity